MESSVKYKPLSKASRNAFDAVFLVDDDMSYLYSLGYYLKRDTKCKIYCFRSGEECLANMRLKPRIVILDYFLSAGDIGMNGLEVLKKIKELSPRTKVVILSGQETLQVATASLQSGAFTYIVKDLQAPLSIKNIIDANCSGDVPGSSG